MSLFYIPTYEECKLISSSNEVFYEKKVCINGYKISIFNYRLAELSDFLKPIPNSNIQATELRGLTFVHSELGTTRYLGLHKFFNLNQCQGYQYSDVQQLQIKQVQNKLDGSMIFFIRLPNGEILSKTKCDFNNDQSIMAQNLYEKDINIQQFIKETLDKGLSAVFELVSPRNQIVIIYPKTELLLLQLRDEKTGEYYDIYNEDLVKKYKIKTTIKEESILTLEEYVELAKTREGSEGWVITLKNGQMLKLKTQWYIDRHSFLTFDLVHEDRIVFLILNEQIDDVLSMINENDSRRAYATKIREVLLAYFSKKEKECIQLLSLYNGNKKDFHSKYNSHGSFSLVYEFIGDLEKYFKNKIIEEFDDSDSFLISTYLIQENLSVDNFNEFISFLKMQDERRPFIRNIRNITWNKFHSSILEFIKSLSTEQSDMNLISFMKDSFYNLIKKDTLAKTYRLMEAKQFLTDNGLHIELIKLDDGEE